MRQWVITINNGIISFTSLQTCDAAFNHVSNCLLENNFNTEPTTDAEFCAMALLYVDCLDSAFAATTCAGKQAAIEASQRLRAEVVETCASLGVGGTAAVTAVTGFFTVVMMTLFSLFH